MTHTANKPSPEFQRLEAEIARMAAAYPEVVEENPWGHRAFKVRAKTFLFLGASDTEVSLSVKLPQTGDDALALVFTEPTHYGLGKSGWVTAHLTSAEGMTLELVGSWLRESYLAIAPKKLHSALSSDLPDVPQEPKAKVRALPQQVKAAAKVSTPKPKPAAKVSRPKSKQPAAKKPTAKKPAGARPTASKRRSKPAL